MARRSCILASESTHNKCVRAVPEIIGERRQVFVDESGWCSGQYGWNNLRCASCELSATGFGQNHSEYVCGGKGGEFQTNAVVLAEATNRRKDRETERIQEGQTLSERMRSRSCWPPASCRSGLREIEEPCHVGGLPQCMSACSSPDIFTYR